jgi:CIC family chloride channel protein
LGFVFVLISVNIGNVKEKYAMGHSLAAYRKIFGLKTKKRLKIFNSWVIRFLLWKTKYLNDEKFVILVSVLVGANAGLAAVLLKYTVHYVQGFLSDDRLFTNNFGYATLLYPVLGLQITVWLINNVFKINFGRGFADIIFSISNRKGNLGFENIYIPLITSVFTVGFGGSAGLESPIVLSGAAQGSNAGGTLLLKRKHKLMLIGCGIAGSVSAIFNAPVAAVIFAMEVILFETTIERIIPIVLASVSGKMIAMFFLGGDVLFSFQLKDSFQATDVLFCFFLGILMGFVSLFFAKILFFTKLFFQRFENIHLRALAGGCLLSLIIFVFPDIYGEGYELIKAFLNGNDGRVFYHNLTFSEFSNPYFFVLYIFLLAAFKIFAAAVTINSGGSGGVFAPSLFIGGDLGFAFARLINLTEIGAISESNFTLIGMAAAMSGVQYAPLAAIFLIAELTGGYELFLPLMVASAFSYITASFFEPNSIYTRNLIERGDLVKGSSDKKVLKSIKIKALIENDFLSISENALLGDLVECIRKSNRNIFPVLNESGELKGIITLADVREIMFDTEKQNQTRIADLMQQPAEFIDYQDEMTIIMHKFERTNAWNLPVIRSGKYVGFISKSNMFNRYRDALIEQND